MLLYKFLNHPSYKQVAEWRHNTTPIPAQIRILKDICDYIKAETKSVNNSNIYWTVENNTIGEACPIVINDMGEENIPDYLLVNLLKKDTLENLGKDLILPQKQKQLLVVS